MLFIVAMVLLAGIAAVDKRWPMVVYFLGGALLNAGVLMGMR
jgi:hypothetical protein